MIRFAQVVSIAVLCCTIGLHWALMQSVAWVGMFASYSTDHGITTALLKTFDGNNPCSLCIAVEEGRHAEKRRQSDLSLKKHDWMLDSARLVLDTPVSTAAPNPTTQRAASRCTSPPTPPPRLA